ncbi:K(+)-transporting ATPase subunit C [Flavobacterium psychrotrophum]|uniref:K(+)-transporting ATPase subunit C n=1 Tax=Flavobacterium psychrotrophum TaxID=2294119 RepID=UPI000E311F1B|nr:K(+)-transporting ATPase subunit C [Flavobacterium psychrotrophum]
MKTIFQTLKITLLGIICFSGVYTMIVYGAAQIMPNRGKGNQITANGKTYYTNIAQAFTKEEYFWPRPSAVDYNAAGSAGSNKGPSNADYLAQVQTRIDSFLIKNPGIEKKDIPAEMVTASGSGLDPHISPQAAKVQVKRVAKARNLSEAIVQKTVDEHTEKPLLGPAVINVLELNLALDK